MVTKRERTNYYCSVTKLRPTLRDSMDCSTPGFPVLHQPLELTQTHVHGVGDAIQPSHPLSSPSPPAFNLSQGLSSGSFQMSQLFASSGQRIGVSASALVLRNSAGLKHSAQEIRLSAVREKNEGRLFFFFLQVGVVLGLHCCTWTFSGCGKQGLLFTAM